LVTGCVYNADNMPTYPLPDQKQVSGFKTQTMDGAGYNELIFDDTAGAELIRVHGQHDLEVTILNDETHEIGNDSTRVIKGNRTDSIEKGQDITVTGARSVTVQSKETKTVTDVLSVTSQTKIELKVGGSSITIDMMGIKITAPKIEIAASLQLETNGSMMAKHTSGGVVQIQGPLVTIN
jgi:type VI secretion system secreted protein VgrG